MTTAQDDSCQPYAPATFLGSVTLLKRNRAVCEIMWKNILEPGKPRMRVWRMRISCWINKTTDAHSKYVIGVLINPYPDQEGNKLHSPHFMALGGSLPHSQESTTCPYPSQINPFLCPSHFWQAQQVSFLVGLRIYQHPDTYCFSTATMVARKRPNAIHCISCF